MIYHTGATVGSVLPLSELLTRTNTEKDTEGQQPPVGYAIIGWHVDDGTGLACSVGWNLDYSTNRGIHSILALYNRNTLRDDDDGLAWQQGPWFHSLGCQWNGKHGSS